MSQQYSTVLKMGASAPFVLIMALPVGERVAFARAVSPMMLNGFQVAIAKGGCDE